MVKIRTGFVSNSSTSCFIILVDKNLTISYKKLSEYLFNHYFYVRNIGFMKSLAKKMVSLILARKPEEKSKENEIYGYFSSENVDLIMDKYYVYKGVFSSESDGLEIFMCDQLVIKAPKKFQDEIIFIKPEAGY